MNDKFLEVFELYKDDIYRLAFSYTLNIHDSEDIVQNVFTKLYKNSKLIESDYLKQWLFRVTINESKNYLKSHWIRKVFKLNDDVYSIKTKDKNDDILNDLNNLPKKYRIVLFLYYYEGYSIKEISKILNTNVNTIKTHLKRAKEKLKMEMED